MVGKRRENQHSTPVARPLSEDTDRFNIGTTLSTFLGGTSEKKVYMNIRGLSTCNHPLLTDLSSTRPLYLLFLYLCTLPHQKTNRYYQKKLKTPKNNQIRSRSHSRYDTRHPNTSCYLTLTAPVAPSTLLVKFTNIQRTNLLQATNISLPQIIKTTQPDNVAIRSFVPPVDIFIDTLHSLNVSIQ